MWHQSQARSGYTDDRLGGVVKIVSTGGGALRFEEPLRALERDGRGRGGTEGNGKSDRIGNGSEVKVTVERMDEMVCLGAGMTFSISPGLVVSSSVTHSVCSALSLDVAFHRGPSSPTLISLSKCTRCHCSDPTS